ncbi:MAG: tellurite resistance TerB family protein [Hyphomonadaceae bacterium]
MSEFFVASLGPQKTQNPLSWSSLLEAAAEQPRDSWSVPEAFLTILFAAVTADGELAPIEHEELLALTHRSRALKTLKSHQLADLNVRIIERMRGSESVLRDACAALPTDMRLSVFAHALDLILADGELNEDEADFLNALILGLGLGREDVERIATVIEQKNRF